MQDNLIKYNTFNIHSNLKKFIRFIWTIEAEPNEGDYFVFRTYATIFPTVLFAINGHVEPIGKPVTENILLVGQSNKWCRYKASKDFKIFGITFYPFALPLLFDFPASSITNKNLDLEFISKNKLLAQFCQKVIASNFDSETINKVVLEMTKKSIINDEKILPLILDISSGDIKVAEINSDHVFMSQRNFERKFKYYSGFTPKTFTNIIRLIKSFNAISFEHTTLSNTAFEQSYFDQAHFSNEFKKHTGFQPKVFVKNSKTDNWIWQHFVEFFQFLSICPPVLCKNKINSIA